jgi:hypothetical protein
LFGKDKIDLSQEYIPVEEDMIAVGFLPHKSRGKWSFDAGRLSLLMSSWFIRLKPGWMMRITHPFFLKGKYEYS